MRKKFEIGKRYKIIGIILTVYLIGFFLIFGLSNVKDGKRKLTLLVGDNTFWRYSDKSWLNITTKETINSLNWQKYKVYLDNKYFGEYSLWYDDSKWYAFKSDKSAVIMEGDLLAYSSNFDLDIKEFEIKENTNNTYVHQVLAKNELPTSSQMTINSVVKVDIDNDGIEEEIYTISNAFASDFYPDKLFSIAFMVKDEQIYSMYTNIEEASFGNGCKPYVRAILDINEDKTYEVILTCGKFSIQKQEDMLFKLNKEKFDLLISNQ